MKVIGLIGDFFIWSLTLTFIGIVIFLNYKVNLPISPSLYFLLSILLVFTFILMEEKRRNKRRKEYLASLEKTSLSLAKSLDLAYIFKETAICALNIIKDGKGCILSQIAGGMLQIRHSLNIPGKPDNTFGLIVKKKNDIVCLVLPKEKPDWAINYKYFIGIPLKVSEEIIGALEVYFEKRKRIKKEEIERLLTLSSYAAAAITNARQYEETSLALKKEKQAFIALSTIDKSLKEKEIELTDQLNIILKETFRATGAMKSEIWIWDEKKREFACITVYPLIDMVYGIRCSEDEGLFPEIIKSQKIINCPSLTKEPRFTNPLKRNVSSGLFIPLLYREKFLGVMILFNKNGNQPFLESDYPLIESLSTQAAITIFQAKMYYKFKNVTSSLVSLYEISRTLAEGKELNNVLGLILKKGCELFYCENGSIMLLDQKTGELTIKVAFGLSDEIIKNTKKYIGDGSIAGWVAKERKPLILIGKIFDERFSSVKEKVKDSLCVPMVTKDRLIGVLSLSNRKGQGIFEEADMELLTTLANEAALAIETASLYNLSQKRIRELLGIKRLSDEVVLRKDRKEIIGLSLTIGCELLEASFALFFEKDSNDYILTSARGKERMDERDFEQPSKIGDKTVQWIAENKKPLIIDKCEEDPRFFPIKGISSKTLLGLPVVFQENLLGVVEFFNKEPYFTQDDIRLGGVLAYQMAIAIENINLFMDIKKNALLLSTVNNIAKEIIAMPESDDIEKLSSQILFFSSRVIRSKKAWFHIVCDRELILKAHIGLNDIERKREEELSLGKGIAGMCALEKELFLIKDIWQDKRIREEERRKYRPGSYISCPIIVRDDVLGVISFSEKVEGEYNEDDANFLLTLSLQVSVAIENSKLHLLEKRYKEETLKLLSSIIEEKTKGKGEMVAKYSKKLAEFKNLDKDEIENIVQASYLVDIGMIGTSEDIKDEIFLTKEERERLEQHPILGVKMLRGYSFFKPIIKIIYHHHENYDGTGYPDGLVGESIPIGSRIIAIADSFSSFLKKGNSPEEALRFLKEKSGSFFDPELVSMFINSLED